VALKALEEEFLMSNCNLNYRHTWPSVRGLVKQHDVLPTTHDLIVELLGEKSIVVLMESRWNVLTMVSSVLKTDVQESSETQNPQEEQVASLHATFQTMIDPSMGRDFQCLLENLQEQTRYICNKHEYGVERIIENQEAMGARIIETFHESFTKIENFQKQLQKKLCKKVDTLMEFNVQLQQRNIPRLAYFVQKKNMMQSCKTLVTSFVPGLECAQLHLMCEHIDGIHVVKDQEGFEVMLGSETFQKVQPLVDKGLWVLSILLKVGAQLTVGLASQVPNLNVGAILGGMATIIPSQFPTTMSFDDVTSATTNNEDAANWLVETMEKVPSIAKSFDLHKVTFVTGRCQGQVAWVCGDCKAKDKSLREIQSRH
jgi:hypothetical protein